MTSWNFNYVPRPQMVDFHNRTQKNAYILAHRRFGKTVACIAELILRALYSTKKNPQYAYVAPFRSQAKSVAWQYLVDMTEGISIDVKVSELMVQLPNKAKIFLTGSDNENSLRGNYYDGIIIDEYAQVRPDLLEAVLMPALLDRNGWLVVIGTAYGRMNKFFTLYEKAKDDPAWFFADIKATESGVLTPEQIEDIKFQISEAKFQQEFMNNFSAEIVGTYYASIINELEAQGRLKGAAFEPAHGVNVAFDIGRRDSTVAWFWQERMDGIAVIDHYANNGQQAAFYIDMLKSKPYAYDNVWLPHDARAMTFATRKSAIEQFIEAGLPTHIVPKLSLEDGIEAVRQTLRYAYFDYTNTYEGVECLRMYRKTWDGMKQCFSQKPLHDYTSDHADAFRYLAIVANKKRIKPPEPLPSATITFKELYESQPKPRFRRI